ncbi:unnamed protein product, partial [Didymodactylos carnosus]
LILCNNSFRIMPQPGLTTPPSARASTSPLNTSGGSAPQILTNGSPPPLQQQNSMPMGMGGGMSFGPPHAQMRNFGPPPDNFFQGPMAMHGPPPGMNMSMHGPMSPHLGMNANLLGGPPRMMQMHGPGGNMHMMTRMGMMPKIYPPNQHHITNPSNPNSAPIAICGKCHEETHDTDGCILCE